MRMVGAAALGAAGLAAYSFYEPYRYRVGTHELPVASTCPPLSILHLSDTHLSARDRKLVSFLRSLPDRVGVPDLVVATGDMIEGDDGIEPLLGALADVDARLGRFYVLGSHDYYAPRYEGFAKYFTRSSVSIRAPHASTSELEEGLQSKGWQPLANTTVIVDSDHGRIRMAGVDDPFLDRHETDHIARADGEVAAIALVHAPDVVSQWVLNGFDLILAGHTHGGQVRFPFLGALVTNCSLPAALAAGPTRVGAGWLHVSPGLGTGHFAPIRFACRPEATLLQLRPQLA